MESSIGENRRDETIGGENVHSWEWSAAHERIRWRKNSLRSMHTSEPDASKGIHKSRKHLTCRRWFCLFRMICGGAIDFAIAHNNWNTPLAIRMDGWRRHWCVQPVRGPREGGREADKFNDSDGVAINHNRIFTVGPIQSISHRGTMPTSTDLEWSRTKNDAPAQVILQ